MQSVISFLPIAIALIFILCILIVMILNKNSKLSKQIRLLEESPCETETSKFLPGSRAVIPNFGLTFQQQQDKSFNVTYEVNIIEVSETKIKVSAYDFVSIDVIGKDPLMRQSILSFMQNMWVDKDVAEILMDKNDIRDFKIDKILDSGR